MAASGQKAMKPQGLTATTHIRPLWAYQPFSLSKRNNFLFKYFCCFIIDILVNTFKEDSIIQK